MAGGRQRCSAPDQPGPVDGLLLLSYPLHPPRKPTHLRTQHLPKLQTSALFVHGTRDPFGSIEEMEAAIKLIPIQGGIAGAGWRGARFGFQREGEARGIACGNLGCVSKLLRLVSVPGLLDGLCSDCW
jgi:hypothetical protein